jgi:hypothetical protein
MSALPFAFVEPTVNHCSASNVVIAKEKGVDACVATNVCSLSGKWIIAWVVYSHARGRRIYSNERAAIDDGGNIASLFIQGRVANTISNFEKRNTREDSGAKVTRSFGAISGRQRAPVRNAIRVTKAA